MDKAALEELLSEYNSKMGWATIFVAVGIFGEYVSHFLFSKEKKERNETIATIVFGLLVLGGVIGEWQFGSKLSDVAGQIQSRSDAEVIAAQNAARDAYNSARDAHNASTAAQRQARDATDKARRASTLASDNNKKAARLGKEAEDERLARVNIEKQITWRVLSREQVAILSAPIPPNFVGVGVDFMAVSGDTEGSQYLEQIRQCMSLAGWKTELPGAGIFSGIPPQGVIVEVGTQSSTPAVLLHKILEKAGIDSSWSIATGMDITRLKITVGVKPLPTPTSPKK